MPDRTGIFFGGWSANLSNFLGLGVEAGASPMYPQKMRVPHWDSDSDQSNMNILRYSITTLVRHYVQEIKATYRLLKRNV